MKREIYILTGPTAVGKTEQSLRLAEEKQAEIISCDASLFYRGMDIGTAKPTREERRCVPHHMIDICPVSQPFDIVRYVDVVAPLVESIFERGHSVLVTGGSGFYLKSFLSPVMDTIVVSDSLRAETEALFDKAGLEGLLQRLRRFNPDGFGNLDVKNPRRVLRALERCEATGSSLRDLADAFSRLPTPYADCGKTVIVLQRSRSELHERVSQRAEAMLDAGLVEEVKGLLSDGILENPSAASAIGYRESIRYLQGELSADALLSEIITNTRRLVKKQSTWFRTQLAQVDEVRVMKG